MTLQEPSAGPVAQSETLVFLSFFEDLPDPRQTGKVIYPLQEVLLLCLLAVLAGAESFVEIARFGEKKIELLRRFLPFKDGTPSHDQLGDIFATLDATIFQRCFVAWVASITGVSADVIAIDGKTSRRSADKRGGWPPDSCSCLKRSSAFSLEVMKISFALELRNAGRLVGSLRTPTVRNKNCSEEAALVLFESVRWKPAKPYSGFTPLLA
jgi:hypothetical protein